MEDLFEFLIVIGFVSVMAGFFYFIFQILSLKVRKLRQEVDNEKDLGQVTSLKKDIGYLMAENEEMKEELRNIKYLLGNNQERQAIDLKEYEKQQIEIDKRNKFEL